MNTTYFKDVIIKNPPEVYEPAEDSFLLANFLDRVSGKIMDMGTGSGILAILAAKNPGNDVTAADISEEALECAKENAKENGSHINTLQTDLFTSLEDGKYDAILFNPPYLPTSKKEKLDGPINRAFDGGKDGREIIDRFLREFDSYLNPGGNLLMVSSSLSDTEKTLTILRQKGFQVQVLKDERIWFEKLSVIGAKK